MATPLHAQKDLENNEVFVTVGADVPMYNGIESDVIIGIHYGHYYPDGTGFRAGFQYTPTVVDIDNYIYHLQEGTGDTGGTHEEVTRYTVKHIRWFFTFSGGLAFRF